MGGRETKAQRYWRDQRYVKVREDRIAEVFAEMDRGHDGK